MLFPDTFNNFFEPEVAIAAVEVLERAGFRVTIPPKYVCCGRPLYDQGMLEEAKLQLAKVMQVLRPCLERGTPIVGLEPGCILTFRDELPRLYPNDPLAEALARQSFMFEEFIARLRAGNYSAREKRNRAVAGALPSPRHRGHGNRDRTAAAH